MMKKIKNNIIDYNFQISMSIFVNSHETRHNLESIDLANEIREASSTHFRRDQ